MDAGAIGYGIVQVTLLVVGIFLIFLFKTILFSFFKLFEEYYSPFNYKRKESFLRSKFDHLIINKSLSQTELKSINFNSFNDFEYPNFLLKNQKNKIIDSLLVNIPVVNYFARWIQRRIFNILSLEPERKDNKKDKNHVWEVVLSISYIKSDKKKDVKQLILLEISDEDLNKEMGLDSFVKEPVSDTVPKLIVKDKVRFEGESKRKSVLEKSPSLNLNKQDAIKKLKEKKELLDLEIITKEEYNKIKDELKSIIIKEDNNEKEIQDTKLSSLIIKGFKVLEKSLVNFSDRIAPESEEEGAIISEPNYDEELTVKEKSTGSIKKIKKIEWKRIVKNGKQYMYEIIYD